MIDEKLTVQAGQQIAWQLVEALRSGPVCINDEPLNPKFQKVAINFLRHIAEAEPKVIHELFKKPIPKESGERAARKPGPLQGLAYELSKNGSSITQVAKKLGVKRSTANELINAGRDIFHQRMQRNKAKTTDE